MKIVCSVPIQEKRWSFSLWKFKFESVVETCVHIRKSHNHAADENGHSIFSVYWPLVFGEGIVWLGTPRYSFSMLFCECYYDLLHKPTFDPYVMDLDCANSYVIL